MAHPGTTKGLCRSGDQHIYRDQDTKSIEQLGLACHDCDRGSSPQTQREREKERETDGAGKVQCGDEL